MALGRRSQVRRGVWLTLWRGGRGIKAFEGLYNSNSRCNSQDLGVLKYESCFDSLLCVHCGNSWEGPLFSVVGALASLQKVILREVK